MGVDDNIGLVFSGGGSRGSYQIGVWQALIDMGLDHKISAAYGTSVGAINGAAFIQGNVQLALDIWQNINYAKVFADLPNERPKASNRNLYISWLKGALRNRGLDVSPLKETIRSSIEEDAIRSSPLDFGLVTFDLKKRKALYLTKEEIPEGQLVEYIIASATFPVFQPHRIEDRLFLDGGLVDNRPLSFFKNNTKINKIIVVDVTMARHVWPNVRVKGDVDMYYVRPSRLLGSPMAFDHKRIISNLNLGYQDGRKQLARISIGR